MSLSRSSRDSWIPRFKWGWGKALFVMMIATSPCTAADPVSLELPIKATFLQKFGDFVGWPESAFAQAGGVFNICIYGDDLFGPLIDKLAQGNKSAGHVIAVRRLQSIAEASTCHVLYFGRTDRQTVTNSLHALRGKPVLTVTDERNGNEPRGIIHFVLEDNHVRFAIDDESASENGLTISSKLLNVATTVTVRRRGNT